MFRQNEVLTSGTNFPNITQAFAETKNETDDLQTSS